MSTVAGLYLVDNNGETYHRLEVQGIEPEEYTLTFVDNWIADASRRRGVDTARLFTVLNVNDFEREWAHRIASESYYEPDPVLEQEREHDEWREQERKLFDL